MQAYHIIYLDWISAGEFQIGDSITPLDPETVESVVQYGMYGFPISDEATGYSLVYNQLYPFEGLQNYTSGIIHHVFLTGITSHVISAHLGRFNTHLKWLTLSIYSWGFSLLVPMDDSYNQ